ncbi:MAG: hypothetical protein ABSA78_06045 [Candidatus Sulfotelmatobacter sp.]|jgi:hypothetical protein
MSARNGIVLLLALSTLTLLVGCGSSGNAVVTPPPSGSFSASDLNGTYVFSVSGTDAAGAAYAIVGAFTANGKGGSNGITGGTIDITDPEEGVEPQPDLSITGGSYSVGADGRGQMTIATNPANIFNTPLTFDFVLSSSSHGLIVEFDDNATGSGTIDAQAAGVTPNGTYAFSLAGATAEGSPWATVGNFTVSGQSIAGLDDLNEGGVLAYPAQTLTGSLVAGPSSSPATTLFTAAFSGLFDVYVIDATHLKFIEMDDIASLSGDAYSQTSAAIPTANMAFTLAGATSSDIPFAAGGFMLASGNNITGNEDYNVTTSASNPAEPPPITGTYASGGTGRYTLNFSTFVGGSDYAAYPYAISSSLQGLLLLEIDNLGVTAGAAYAQTPGATFASAQGYALNLTGLNNGIEEETGSLEEVDDIAEFTAAVGGNCTTAFAICGIIDENADPGGSEDLGAPFYDLALADGTYAGPDTNGRYVLFANAGNSNVSTLNGGFNLTYYAVDGTTFPFMESDTTQTATGVMVLQSPSDPSAGAARSHMLFVHPVIHSHGAAKAHGSFKKRNP